MSGVNKVILVGNLGKDPEVTYTSGGKAVCKFSLATSEKWTDANGEQKEKTDWHRVVVWGKLAEICGQYLAKGRKAYIEGKISYGQYEKDGVTHYTTDIVAQNVIFLDGGSGGGYGEKQAPQAKQQHQNNQEQQRPPSNSLRQRPVPIEDQDIPF